MKDETKMPSDQFPLRRGFVRRAKSRGAQEMKPVILGD
jgi:hypothetical protein